MFCPEDQLVQVEVLVAFLQVQFIKVALFEMRFVEVSLFEARPSEAAYLVIRVVKITSFKELVEKVSCQMERDIAFFS